MDSPQMYDTQHGGQPNGIMNNEMKKPVNGSPNNNNNSSSTNNNNLTTLNNNNGTTKQTAALLKQHHLSQQHLAQQYQAHGGNTDLSDLSTPEISLDLQNLIDDSQFSSDAIFSDLLATQNPGIANKHGVQTLHNGNRQMLQSSSAARYPNTTLAYMPQPVHSGAGSASSYVAASGAPTGANSDSNSSMDSDVPSIKEEPMDPQEYRRQCAAGGYMPGAYSTGTPTFATLAPGGVLHHQHHQLQSLGGGSAPGLPGMKGVVRNGSMGHHPHHPHHGQPAGRKSLKPTDKSSDEYRRRRERNNIAVRKSREKAKVRTRETEEKVKLLVKENERLQKRIELLTEELNVLRSLFSNVGVLPEHLHREINKHLDSFQLQHQQHQQHMSEDRRVLDILQEYGP